MVISIVVGHLAASALLRLFTAFASFRLHILVAALALFLLFLFLVFVLIVVGNIHDIEIAVLLVLPPMLRLLLGLTTAALLRIGATEAHIIVATLLTCRGSVYLRWPHDRHGGRGRPH